MVRRSETGNLGGLWLKGHGLSGGSEVIGRSPRVRRAAPSLQMQSDEPALSSYGLAKTATLTVLDDVQLAQLVLVHDLHLHLPGRERREERGGACLVGSVAD